MSNYQIEKDAYWILHRENGPAVEYNSGNKFWYKHGLLHREDGREDGPAREFINGDKEWYENGEYYRENRPAIEFGSGIRQCV